MNKQFILDASALLALLNQEPGHEKVESILPEAMMSAVNFSETVAVMTHLGMPYQSAKDLLDTLIYHIVPFDKTQAGTTAYFKKTTQQYGLSLGDRACLALAQQVKGHVLTADKIWKKLQLPDVTIELIR